MRTFSLFFAPFTHRYTVLSHVGASFISLAPTFFTKVRARSCRCSSFPNRTRCAGLRFGFGCRPETGGIHSVMILHNLSENSFWMRVFGHLYCLFLRFSSIKREVSSHTASIRALILTMLMALVMLQARKLSPSSAAAFSFPLHSK